MKVSDTPRLSDATWNQFRRDVIQALVEIELWRLSHGRSFNSDGYAYELADKLQLTIESDGDFSRLRYLAISLLPLAKDTILAVQTTRNGQFALAF